MFETWQKDILKGRLYTCDKEGKLQLRFSNFVLQSLIRPGERQHYLSTRPNASSRVDMVIRSRPGFEKVADKWMEHLALETHQIAQNTECFDECVRDWGIIELFQFYVQTEACIETQRNYFWNYFDLVFLDSELKNELNRYYPMILQNFNWFGVYYRGRFYPHEDASSAALHWLYIVWLNSRDEEVEKFFPQGGVTNLQLRDYKFESCEFKLIDDEEQEEEEMEWG